MKPQPQEDKPNPELEALVQTGISSDDKLGNIDQNTEGSLMKLDDIESNTEANLKATINLEEPLKQVAENTKPKDIQKVKLVEREDSDDEHFNENEAGKALWSMLRGPKGHTPVKGKEYFTEEEVKSFKEDITPVKGKEYFTEEEVKSFKEDITPVKGKDYFDGKDGYTPVKGKDYFDGKDGYTPVKGKDYFDGKDGYTPVKGKDYFDGKDAANIDIKKISKEIEGKVLKQADAKYEENRATLTKHVASKTYAMRELEDTRSATTGQTMVKQADGSWAGASAGSGHTIEDEGTPLTTRTKLNFVGAGVTVTDDSGDDATVVTIPGGAGHDAVTVTDSAEINFTLTGQDITANIIAGSIDETKLDASVNASLDLADTSFQKATVVSGSLTAANDTYYVNVASATYTDPSPTEGKGFIVFVSNGTANVGATAYATAGTIIHRYFHSGAWANYVYNVSSTYETLSNKATDFSTVNDTLYPTVEAVQEYVTSAVVGLLDYRGTYDASTNLFPATGGSGLAGAILKGDFYIVSVAGTLGGTAVTAGDLVIALVDTPAQTSSNWDIVANEAGGGDVVGPASATDNAVARFNSTTGKLIQNSGMTIDDNGDVTLGQIFISGGSLSDAGFYNPSDAGYMIFEAGNAVSADTTGGGMDFFAGAGNGRGQGGGFQMGAGLAGATGQGGNVSISSSDAGGGNSDGGKISLYTGIKAGSGIDGFVEVGNSTIPGKIKSVGNQDLILQTGNATTGTVTITDGANGAINIAPNGTGEAQVNGNRIIDETDTLYKTRTISSQINGSATGSTALATGDGQASLPIDTTLNGMNIVAVKAYVTTVSSSGAVTINIRRSRRSSATARTIVDILSTALTVDVSEFESSDATAPAINTANDDLQTGDMLLIDIDAAGTGVLGLQIVITCQLP